jgi:hypothetical protein
MVEAGPSTTAVVFSAAIVPSRAVTAAVSAAALKRAAGVLAAAATAISPAMAGSAGTATGLLGAEELTLAVQLTGWLVAPPSPEPAPLPAAGEGALKAARIGCMSEEKKPLSFSLPPE